MDLVTLAAACALTVDPKLMHALIWHQSGGEPWLFSVSGEQQPQIYRSAREAVHAALTAPLMGLPIPVGLTGLAADPGAATLEMFMPCPNISVAARQIAQLVDRCRTVPHLAAHSTHHTIAAYRGSWERPDNKFADAVLATVAKDDAPNFEMSGETGDRSAAIAPRAPLPLSTLPPRRWSLLMINSRVGRMRCFPQGRSSSPAPVRAIWVQIDCRSPVR